jgi:uncharacterized protein (UPF0335 family)
LISSDDRKETKMESTGSTNVTQATFLQFIDELDNADQAVAEAVGMRKDIRKRAVGAGLNIKAVDQARKVAEQAGDKREQHDRDFRQYMFWLNKPIGYQSDWIGEAAPAAAPGNGEDTAAVSEHQVHQVSNHGHAAGQAGRDRGSNPWTPGTDLAQVWDTGWLAGQEEIARKIAPTEAPAPRRRGRPPGTRNKPKATAAS